VHFSPQKSTVVAFAKEKTTDEDSFPSTEIIDADEDDYEEEEEENESLDDDERVVTPQAQCSPNACNDGHQGGIHQEGIYVTAMEGRKDACMLVDTLNEELNMND
jgi:hypothetical protein